jgi:hypothetical protein
MGVHLDDSSGVGLFRLEEIAGQSGQGQHTKVERAQIAVKAMIPGVPTPLSRESVRPSVYL